MASNTEISFGARVNNAKQVAIHIASYPAYVPPTLDTTVAAYNALITTIEANNLEVATTHEPYSLAVADRQSQFNTAADSLKKMLSPIGSSVSATYGKTSKEYRDVSSIINDLRGEKTAKLKRDQDGDFVSQSHLGFGSMTENLNKLIATLAAFNPAYAPANANITIPKLRIKLTSLEAANTLVTTTYGISKPSQDLRPVQYNLLSKRTQTIKDGVKSQYGIQSTEYKLIKGIKV